MFRTGTLRYTCLCGGGAVGGGCLASTTTNMAEKIKYDPGKVILGL